MAQRDSEAFCLVLDWALPVSESCWDGSGGGGEESEPLTFLPLIRATIFMCEGFCM